VERTIPAREDLDWLPTSLKALRWTVTGAAWSASAIVMLAIIFFLRHGFLLFWWKPILAMIAGGGYVGDRASRAVVRRRMRGLAHGSVDLAKLRNQADGELVHVIGRVRAGETRRALVSERPCVMQRVDFTVERERWVHETASDFWLVDQNGETVRVEVEGARLIAPEQQLAPLDSERFLRLLGRHDDARAMGTEFVIQDGDDVEVVGYKTQAVDPTVAALPREIPLKATLRGGRLLPLLVSPRR
jgi:hypothetical protein